MSPKVGMVIAGFSHLGLACFFSFIGSPAMIVYTVLFVFCMYHAYVRACEEER